MEKFGKVIGLLATRKWDFCLILTSATHQRPQKRRGTLSSVPNLVSALSIPKQASKLKCMRKFGPHHDQLLLYVVKWGIKCTFEPATGLPDGHSLQMIGQNFFYCQLSNGVLAGWNGRLLIWAHFWGPILPKCSH